MVLYHTQTQCHEISHYISQNMDSVNRTCSNLYTRMTNRGSKSAYQKKKSCFSTKAYVVGTQKKYLNETILLSTQNIS